MAKGISEAGQLIKELIGKGFSKSRIGKAVGRDSSLISQIEKGKKPGSNLVGALGQLREKGKVETAAPRRTTKAGTVAKVRKGTLKTKTGKPIASPKMKAGDKTNIKTLKQFKGQRVVAKLHFKRWRAYGNKRASAQTVTVFGGGVNPETLIENAAQSGQSIEDYLQNLALDLYKPNKAEGFDGLYFVAVGESEV